MVKKRLVHLILFIVVVIFPIFNRDPFILNILITTGIWATSVWGVRLIMSTGQLTLGHAAYMAVGAYASSLLVMKAGLSFWLALPLAGLIAALVALLIGYPDLAHQRGLFFHHHLCLCRDHPPAHRQLARVFGRVRRHSRHPCRLLLFSPSPSPAGFPSTI